jgi:NAD(P)-dependent dehydrogenase (short-subunit alcohol dehydrogenase family)
LIEIELIDQGAATLAYTTSKGAVVDMTMAPLGVSVKAIAPDAFPTRITAQLDVRHSSLRYRTDQVLVVEVRDLKP